MEIIYNFAQKIIHIVNTQHFFQPFMDKYFLGFASYFAKKNIQRHLHFYRLFWRSKNKNQTHLKKNHSLLLFSHACMWDVCESIGYYT